MGTLAITASLCCFVFCYLTLVQGAGIWVLMKSVKTQQAQVRGESSQRLVLALSELMSEDLSEEQQDCIAQSILPAMTEVNQALEPVRLKLNKEAWTSSAWSTKVYALTSDELNNEVKKLYVDAVYPVLESSIQNMTSCVQ